MVISLFILLYIIRTRCYKISIPLHSSFAVQYSIFGSDVPCRCSSAAGLSLSKDFRQHIKVLSNRSKLKFSLQSSKNARKSRAGRDNQLIFHQYTYSTSQPGNGILVLTNEDIENDPLRFLCRGWCFYPDELLTPKDFAQANPSEYMVYRNIGEQTNFASNYNVTPHGCATYVLHLFLPDTEASYSLESPEIYSAYRLYINEALILEVGNPDPDSYQPLTQNRMITFKAAGMTTILLAVSDYSHFYSGLVYPPAFGTTLALNITRFIRLCISVIICTSSLIIGLLSSYKTCILLAICSALCLYWNLS